MLLGGGPSSCVAVHSGSGATGDSCSGAISKLGLLQRMKFASIIRLQQHSQNSNFLVQVGIALSRIPLV